MFLVSDILLIWKNTEVQFLINSGSEINVIILIYITKQGLSIWEMNIEAEKIDGLALIIYGIVITRFLLQDKLRRV